MSTHPNGRSAELRSLIAEFLSARLNAKLEKLAEDDPKRGELQAQFIPAHWLEDAARRVSQIQAVTHSLKPIHPDAKGSSLFCDPALLSPRTALGSHVLSTNFDADVVGNAAALDVYKFLKLEHQGHTVLTLAPQADADLGAALSDDPVVAAAWMAAFASLAAVRGKPSSHTQAKQLYWPVGGDPHDDDQYHLLAPLYPTSLVHKVYQTLQSDRFGDEVKVARAARKASTWHDLPVREYPQLAIQKLGGTKPQNISQLNSERRGDNCLLASLPPMWESVAVQPLWGVDSLFKALRRRKGVGSLVKRLKQFLSNDPAPNAATRARRDELVEDLLDELLAFAAALQTLAPGWTADHRCELPRSHMAWLDPQGDEAIPGDLLDQLAGDFALWLNDQFRPAVILGDAEYQHWRAQARELFKAWEREGLNEFA
jgi:CRISPR-associated protein Csy1